MGRNLQSSKGAGAVWRRGLERVHGRDGAMGSTGAVLGGCWCDRAIGCIGRGRRRCGPLLTPALSTNTKSFTIFLFLDRNGTPKALDCVRSSMALGLTACSLRCRRWIAMCVPAPRRCG